MGRYTIISYDNSTFAEGGTPVSRGEYESAAAAIKRAEEFVDQSLNEHLKVAQDAADLMTYFSIYGSEVPYISGEPAITFDPYEYAKTRAAAHFPTQQLKSAPQRF